MKKASEYNKFILLDELNRPKISAYSGSCILLHTFTNIAVQQFHFPFSGISRVKEALRIQFRPLLGDASQKVSIVPFFVKNEKRTSTGCVFLLFGESGLGDDLLSQNEKIAIWPVALAFAGEVGGTGLIVYADESFITTLWVDNWTPKYHATSPSGKSSVEIEKDTAMKYIASQGAVATRFFTVKKDELSDDDFQRHGANTLAACPVYAALDLSNRGTNLLEMRERMSVALARFGKILAACAALFLILAGGVFYQHRSILSASAQNAETLYFNSFGERSRQPLSSARAKLRSLNSEEGADISLLEIMRSFSTAWGEFGASSDIMLEQLRYGSENTDVMGTADSNESIQKLRALLEEEGYSPRIDNIQRIPNGALRFNMSVTRGERP